MEAQLGPFRIVIDGHFRKDSMGRTVYSPFNMIGPSYIVPTRTLEKVVRRWLLATYFLLAPVCLLSLVTGFMLPVILLLPLTVLGPMIPARRLPPW